MQQISPWRMQRLPNAIDAEYVSHPESEEFNLRDYWKIVVKRRRLILLVFLVVFGLGAYTTSTKPSVYTASATLIIEPQNPTVIQLPEILAPGIGGGQYDYYQTQFVLLRSRPLAARVIAELGLESSPAFLRNSPPNLLDRLHSWLFGFVRTIFTFIADLFTAITDFLWPPPAQEEKVSPPTREPVKVSPPARELVLGVHPRLINRYLSFLTVTPVLATRLVQVVFTTLDPRLSQELANAHATAFIRTTLETRFEMTKEAREFLEKKTH